MGAVTYFSLSLLGILVFTHAHAACPNDWMQFLGNCYAYVEKKLTWAAAEIECQSYGRGTHLASLLNQKESSMVAKFVAVYQKKRIDVWIGLHDPGQNRVWKWSDNAPFNFKSWNANQPGPFLPTTKKFCVEMEERTDFTKWDVVPCDEKNAFVCKRPR